MASTVTTTAPASTRWPSCTPTATTEPGIGLVSSASPLCSSSGRTGASRTSSTIAVRPPPDSQIWPSVAATRYSVRSPSSVTVEPIAVERCGERMRFAVLDPRGGRARCAGEVDVVGALTGMQPERRRRPLAQPPARRHRPQVADRCGPAAQPLVGGRGDQLVVAVLRRNVIGCPAVQQPGVEAAGGDVGIGEQEAQELDVGGDAEHRGVGQRAVERTQRGRPVVGVGDDFGQHRVVLAADDHAGREAGIDTDTGPLGLGEVEHLAAGGQEPARGILRVHPGLDGVAAHA